MEDTSVKDAIKTAIQMEEDGYSFYKKAAAQTSDDMGRTIFESLAKDELIHLDTFKKMFAETIGETEWEDLIHSSKKYADIPIFPKDLKQIEGANPNASELEALRLAMEAENNAIDYYAKIKEGLTQDNVIRIIDEIIEQEKNHFKILEHEFNHLNTTGYWFELDYLGG